MTIAPTSNSKTNHLGTKLQCSYQYTEPHRHAGRQCRNKVVAVRSGSIVFHGTRCDSHGGREQRRPLLAKLQDAIRKRRITQLGRPIEGDYSEFLLQQLWECAGNVAYLREVIRMLQTPIDIDPEVDDDSLPIFDRGITLDDDSDYSSLPAPSVAIPTGKTSSSPRSDQDGALTNEQQDTLARQDALATALDDIQARTNNATIVGRDHLGDLAPSVWWKMYNDERDRLAKLIKQCHDMGLDERKQRLSEAQLRTMATLLLKTIENSDAYLSEDQKTILRKGVADQFRLLTASMQQKVLTLANG